VYTMLLASHGSFSTGTLQKSIGESPKFIDHEG
jgi:hypothetical protein